MKQRIQICRYLLIALIIPVSLIISSCSSGTSTVKDEDETRETGIIAVKEPSRRNLNYEFREREYIRSSNIKSIDKLSYFYDRKNNPVAEGKLSTIFYDKRGLTTKTVNYNTDNEVTGTYDYVYSSDSIRVETRKYTPEGKLENVFKYEYDDDGFKIKSYRYGLNGELEKYYTYEYDDNGNLLTEKWFDQSGKQEFLIEYRYDDSKRRIETISYDSDDNIVSKYGYRYDEEGNIVEEVKYDSTGKETGFIQYVYSFY